MKSFFVLCGMLTVLLLTGCAQPKQYDYSAFKQSKPKSILVLLPQNETPEVMASYGFMSQVTLPLAESGYYVFPVAVVEETFKQNGLTSAQDINSVSLEKLNQIFGADAVLYLNVKQYGTSYQIIMSDTRVTVGAKLVDAHSGDILWSGGATASNTENNSSSGGIIGMLVSAVVTQISDSITDKSHQIAGITSGRLLFAGHPNGILYGPRSPKFGKDAQ